MTILRCILLWVACLTTFGQRYQLVPYPWGQSSGNHLLPSAIAYWQLDEASGNATDASGNGRTLVATGTPGSGTGVVAGSRTFDETNPDYFTNAFNGVWAFTNSAFTVTCWAQLDQSVPHVDDKALFSRGDYGNNTNFCYTLIFDNAGFNDGFNFYWSTDGTFQVTNVVVFPLGGDAQIDYYFVCLRWDGTNFHLSATYITDGAVAADVTGAYSGAIYNTGSPVLSVGQLQGSSIHNMRGQLDEMGVWGRYLSDCEVGHLFAAKAGSFTFPAFDANTCVP